MPENPSRIARMYRKLSPEEEPGGPRRAVPTTWVVGLVAVLMLALPLGVIGSIVGSGDDAPDPDLAAVRVSAAEADDDDGDDDERDRAGSGATVRETVDANTLRDGANSITGNTRIGDTTERPTKDANTLRDGANSITGNTRIGDTTERQTRDGNTARDGANSISGNTRGADTTHVPRAAAPAAQGFAPAYGPANDSVSGGGGGASAGSASG